MSAGSERACAFATPTAVLAGFSRGSTPCASGETKKPPFRPAPDDTKPVLRDPISRSDPVEWRVETDQAVLRLPPFP